MRDADLVFRAQLAAAALEGAWHRWRVVHGPADDPVPTVSSYVGYSLEEPWGQPRVVFGLAAEDAEHLAALLDRHDCARPGYASAATLPGAREFPASNAARPQPLPVPQQASPAREELPGNAGHGDYDEPLFRQAVAAMRQAVAAGEDGNRLAQPADQGNSRPVESALAGAEAGDVIDSDGDANEDAAVGVPSRDDAGLPDDAGFTEAAGLPNGAGQPDTAGLSDNAGDSAGDDALGDGRTGGAGRASMGALARAATTAKAEAEARIKAALTDRDGTAAGHEGGTAADYEDGTAAGHRDADAPIADGQDKPGDRPIAMPRIYATDVLEPLPRPEAASGAFCPADDEAQSGQALPDEALPDEALDGAALDGEAVMADQMAAELGQDDDQESSPSESPDEPANSAGRRSRISRGYSIPRISRTKKPGPVPEA